MLTKESSKRLNQIRKNRITRYSAEYYRVERILIFTHGKELYLVPPGFVTDLTSCPSFLDPYLNDLDTSIPYCALLHDYLLKERPDVDANRVFLHKLLNEGVDPLLSHTLYLVTVVWHAIPECLRELIFRGH